MIKSIKFKQDFRCFKSGFSIDFKPGVNILVGDQGCGKSSLIELIRSLEKREETNDSSWRAKTINISQKISDIVDIECNDKIGVIGIDFERESPRDTSAFHDDLLMIQIEAMRSSHGQATLSHLNHFISNLSKKISSTDTILLDEPDSSLSPRSCYSLVKIIDAIATRWKKQIIVSAHNPIIILGQNPLDKKVYWDQVYSLEDKMWIDGESFLRLQMLPRK